MLISADVGVVGGKLTISHVTHVKNIPKRYPTISLEMSPIQTHQGSII
jgi:hypothetical protein